MEQLRGTGVALVTPMNQDGSIDFQGLGNLLEHTGKRVDYWVVMGTTGESATISKSEKAEILAFVANNNPKNLPIVYGIGGNNTASVVEELTTTDLSAVTAILSVSPYYNKPSQTGIIWHFQQVAEASPKPIILYNVPGRTGSKLTASTILHLAHHPTIVGVKEASADVVQAMKIATKKKEDFLLISGDDLLTQAICTLGGDGVISVLANAYPDQFKKWTDAALNLNLESITPITSQFLKINDALYKEGNPTGIKVVMENLGICKRYVRLPLASASPSLQEEIKAIMNANN